MKKETRYEDLIFRNVHREDKDNIDVYEFSILQDQEESLITFEIVETNKFIDSETKEKTQIKQLLQYTIDQYQWEQLKSFVDLYFKHK